MTDTPENKHDLGSNSKQTNELMKNWKRLSPVAIAYFVITTLKQTAQHSWQALAPLAVVIASKGFNIWWFTLAGAAIIIAVIIVAVLKYLYFRFSMTETSFLIRSGVINKKQLNLAFDRIQNIEIKQPVYFRPFGLSVLTLESAGSSSEEVNLAGIPIGLANTVKSDVIFKQTQLMPVSVNDNTENNLSETNETPIIEQDLKSLIKHGISNNNIWIFAGLAAPILNQFDESLNWLITPEIRNTYEKVEALGPAALIGSTIILGLIILGTLMLISVAASILIYYNYKLFRSGGRIFRQNGLLEKQQANMEESKIQRIVIRQSAIGRMVGSFNIIFKQIGFARNAYQSGKNFTVPALDTSGYKYISSLLYPGIDWKRIKTKPINSMYIRRLVLITLLPLLAIAIFVAVQTNLYAFLILSFLLPLTPIFIQRHKRYRYALYNEYIVMQSGFIGKSISVFPMYKVQNIHIIQSPGQRRKNLATIKVNIAGQTLSMPYIPIEDAYLWRNKILAKIEQSNEPWM
jgi:putative membrane protein